MTVDRKWWVDFFRVAAPVDAVVCILHVSCHVPVDVLFRNPVDVPHGPPYPSVG